MSTRCQIEFRRGDVRRTVYRHWDGYPSAVIPDLLAFLAWSTRSGDIEWAAWCRRLRCRNPFLLPFIAPHGAAAWCELHVAWYFRDGQRGEFRCCDNPRERITFDELLRAA